MLTVRFKKAVAVQLLAVASLCVGVLPSFGAPAHARSSGTPSPAPVAAVLSVTLTTPNRAAAILRALYPRARIRVDAHSNSIIVVGTPDEVQAMRTVIQGIDVKNPTLPSVQVIALHVLKPSAAIAALRGLFPDARIAPASKTSLLVRATAADLAQINTLLSSLDTAPPVAARPTSAPADTIRVMQANPRVVARTIAREVPDLRVSVTGSTVILVGPIEDISKAKVLAQSLDQPASGSRYTQIYRLNNVDVASVADLISKAYPNLRVTVDHDLNALSVFGTAAEHQRIAGAIAQLDGQAPGPGSTAGSNAPAAYGSSNLEVVDLQAALPGLNQANSTSAQDIATTVTQLLGQMAPDLKVAVIANGSQIGLAGSPQSIRLAKELISRLDRVAPQVVLDTEILELDENVARNLGLQLPGAAISSTFSELSTPTDPITGLPGKLIGLQPLGRTPVQFQAQLNLLIQKGNGRVLADPRITTLSGKTATIRAGDTIAILTSIGGGVGTPVTQQLQTFNTGVTLDITPMVGTNSEVTVALHPVVNSLSGILNGVPQIATRDTQTMVHLRNNETLVIGGLIEESSQKSISRIPLLGDLPLVGRLFRDDNINYTRNELIIVVTPHVLFPGEAPPPPDASLPVIPTPRPLPTLPPGTDFPTQQYTPPPPVYVPTATPTDQRRASPITPPPMPPVPTGPGATLHTPLPSSSPIPLPTPSAFAATNVFEFGTAPQNTFARDSDPPQIFYGRFAPTLLKQGVPVTVSVVTTSNIRRVTVGNQGYETTLSQIAPSKWQATFNFNLLNVPSGQYSAQVPITAYRSDGVSSSIQVPISLQQ